MDSQRQQASDRIKQANNILVTVSNNPSVDQLAACIGLTVSLNKMGKHATAVFSGTVPSTLEFLQPEKTIEKNTDSLRDFIIALDKSKADKLRYKVEDRVVKIFITPYRTSITDKDLEFSQGDFNVDVVVALGVHNQNELDLAITSHGRILHDATIITMNTQPGGELGSINWLDPNASSLSEIVVQLVNDLDKNLLDTQVATAFLTGIVAETERFSNGKTSPQTMSISAQLMSSGANQQLVATKLAEPAAPPPPPPAPIATQEAHGETTAPEPVKKSNDGTLEIAHDETKTAEEESAAEDRQEAQKPLLAAEDMPTEEPAEPEAPPAPQIHIDEHGSLSPVDKQDQASQEERILEDMLPPAKHDEPIISHHNEPPKMIVEPPTLGGSLTASGTPGIYSPDNQSAGLPGMSQEETGPSASMDQTTPSVGPTILPPDDAVEQNAPGTSFLGDQPLEEPKPSFADEAGKTLSDIERDVHSTHLNQPEQSDESVIPDSATPPAQVGNEGILPPVSEGALPAVSTPEDTSIPDMPVPAPVATAPAADPSLDEARNAVEQAMNVGASAPLEPIQALNAQPMGDPINNPVNAAVPAMGYNNATSEDSNAPPSVPPPMMPPPLPPAR